MPRYSHYMLISLLQREPEVRVSSFSVPKSVVIFTSVFLVIMLKKVFVALNIVNCDNPVLVIKFSLLGTVEQRLISN